MLDQIATQWKLNPASRDSLAMRRNAHGSSPWTRSSDAARTRQPQDGAESADTVCLWPDANRMHEPEDAYLTGGTRSLTRRLLALNLGLGSSRKAPSVVMPLLPAAAKVA